MKSEVVVVVGGFQEYNMFSLLSFGPKIRRNPDTELLGGLPMLGLAGQSNPKQNE
jgi:hypothetical protein